MQIPLHTVSSAEAYVANQEWRQARLEQCPLHPPGECSIARHGSYPRVAPQATRIARWYCPEGHRTFSLLPDFLAARLPGLLCSIEEAVATAETSTSLEAAADGLRCDDVTLSSAIRWLRRRVRQVHDGLKTIFDLAAQEPRVACPTLFMLRQLGDDHPLLWLRSALPTEVLAKVCVPLGLHPHRAVAHEQGDGDQHEVGPDTVIGCVYGAGITDAVLPCDANPSEQTRADAIPTTAEVAGVWRADRCLRASTSRLYLFWINRFRAYCSERCLDERAELTLVGTRRFIAWYARRHGLDRGR